MRTMAGNIGADSSVLEVQIEGPPFTVYKVAEAGKILMQLLRGNRGGGIILFYNHIGKRRITKDPTPIEVEMRLYEKDVNETIIDNAARMNKEE